MDEAPRIALMIVDDPADPAWRLFTVSQARTRLLVWHVDPRPVDAGVPQTVASILCEALCACGVIVYLAPRAQGLRQRDGWARDDADGRRWRHAVSVFPGFRVVYGVAPPSLIATTDAGIAIEAFDMAIFNWTLQGQQIFVFPHGDPPAIDCIAVQAAFWDRPLNRGVLTGQPILRALLLPGNDGDVAQFAAFDAATWPEFETALRQASAARNIPVHTTTEALIAESGVPRTQQE